MNPKAFNATMKHVLTSLSNRASSIHLKSWKFLLALILFTYQSHVWAQGSGHSIKFNGINQSVNLGHDIDYPIRTIELWFILDENIT